MTDIWTKNHFSLLLSFFSSNFYFDPECFERVYIVSSSFSSILLHWVFSMYQENHVAYLSTDFYFAILSYLKIKVTYLCWQVLLVICLREPWAIQPFTILAENSSRHFHLPDHNQCCLLLCSLLSRPNTLNLLIWKPSNVIGLSNCNKSKYK